MSRDCLISEEVHPEDTIAIDEIVVSAASAKYPPLVQKSGFHGSASARGLRNEAFADRRVKSFDV